MATLAWLDPEERRIFSSYARSARALFFQFDRDLERDVGLPRTFFEILWLLHEAEGHSMRMSDLAEKTGSQPSRITHAVGRLEQDGQVRREHCTDDRRGWFAVLTDQGLETLKIAAPRYAQSVREYFLEPLSQIEREQVVSIGETLLQKLGSTPFAQRGIATSAQENDLNELKNEGALST